MLYFVWKFYYSLLCPISIAFLSSPLPEGFSHLGLGLCVSIAGCMIRPGRLVILASSRERYDIYFSNPWPWRWKMHASSLAKAVWVIIYASVSSPMSRPYWSAVWQVMHDASLYPPSPTTPVHIASSPPLSVCPYFDKHLSSSNLDPESAHHPQLPSASLHSPTGLFFTLLSTFTAPSKSSPCLSSLYVSPPSIYKDTRLFVICKDMRHKLHVTQAVVSYLNVSPTQTDMQANYLIDGVWRYAHWDQFCGIKVWKWKFNRVTQTLLQGFSWLASMSPRIPNSPE